ncbi:MAG: HPr(Ser) kinase/phosphatase [Leptospiraceae bacterium]|nr:HPr kinase/phosphorylase [Leptospiraceae bacterium]MCK6379811.1 HPr(Ser) kinase/phosphatase [Leptospiraceae bacterium]
MSIQGISVESIWNDHKELDLSLLEGEEGLGKQILNSEINRPGLSLTGFFDHFAYDRIQIFGKGEWAYLHSLSDEKVQEIAEQFFAYSLVCIIFTHSNPPHKYFVQMAKSKNVPIFTSNHSTSKFITLISQILDRSLAPRTMRHGVLIEVFGIGILLFGKSGVGKSETALELIERGHRLVADDMVEIRRVSESFLIGTCSDLLRHHMEIRGLGIINIKDIFGVGSVRESKLIELIINLEEWNPELDYERSGLTEQTEEILGVNIPFLKIPIKPGRNIPIIVETASMNQRLKKMGTFGAQEFNKKLVGTIEREKNQIEKNQNINS